MLLLRWLVIAAFFHHIPQNERRMASISRPPLELAHERHQGLPLLGGQLHAEHEVEEFHRSLQSQESAVVQVGG